MKSKIVKIGKSYGVILPQQMADGLGKNANVEITPSPNGITIDIRTSTAPDFYDINTDDDIFLYTDLSHELELEK